MKVVIWTEAEGTLWERTANEDGKVVILKEDRALFGYLSALNRDVTIAIKED